MPKYSFIAKGFDGSEKKGEVETKDEKSLAEQLRAEGFLPVSIKPVGEKSGSSGRGNFLHNFMWVPLSEKMVFTRNLAVMISSGMTLSKAIIGLSQQTKNRRLQKILLDIYDNIQAGKSLADSMEKYQKIFGELFINMVRVGESSGNLEEVLKILATQLEKDHSLISKVRGAMIYPCVILIAMVGIGILMMIYVIPQITGVFADLEVELPPMTQFIIGTSDFMKNHTAIFLASIVAFVFLIQVFLKTGIGKRIISIALINIPFIKSIVIKVNCARFSRVYSSLIRSGVPVLETMDILSRTLTNNYYRKALLDSKERIQKGTALSVVIKEYPKVFPPLVYQMLEVGEETGKTEVVMLKLAQFYEEAVDQITKNMSSIIEPVLMLIIGAAVGLFAVSILQPIYSVMENIK